VQMACLDLKGRPATPAPWAQEVQTEPKVLRASRAPWAPAVYPVHLDLLVFLAQKVNPVLRVSVAVLVGPVGMDLRALPVTKLLQAPLVLTAPLVSAAQRAEKARLATQAPWVTLESLAVMEPLALLELLGCRVPLVLQASPAPGVMTAKMVAMVHQVAVAPQVKWAFQVPVVQLAKSVLPARMAGCMGPLGHLVPLGMTDANAFK